MRDYSRLDAFLNRISEQPSLYDADKSGRFDRSTQTLIDSGFESIRYKIKKGIKALDVGIGKGYALQKFKELGIDAVGISTNQDEVNRAAQDGYNAQRMDMSFMTFPNDTFGIVWARHCLEHSPFPMYTLEEMYRVLRVGGVMYVEVPSVRSGHIGNKNHYSVLPREAWMVLFLRAGFVNIREEDIKFYKKNTEELADLYHRFICEKV